MNDYTSPRIAPVSNYSPIDPSFTQAGVGNSKTRKPSPFGGKDYEVYFQHRKVANLDTFTISSSVETVGQYAMGEQNALGHIQGKRALVGSMTMVQWDKHALMEEVFAVTQADKEYTVKDLWQPESAGSQLLRRAGVSSSVVTLDGEADTGISNKTLSIPGAEVDPFIEGATVARGMTRSQYKDLVRSQITETALRFGRRKIIYSDQLPPFDVTIVGLNDLGDMAYTTVYGIKIIQETSGWSISDMSGVVALSFVALHHEKWRNLKDDKEIFGQ